MIKVNGNTIKFDKFPNKETLVDTTKLNEIGKLCRIDFKWEKDEDIIHLCFVLGHLKEKEKCLYIWYMPYSRMDRSQNGSCFTLSHICTIINSFLSDSDKVYVLEPHSDKTLALLKNCKRVNIISTLMQEVCNLNEIDIICYPDKGAKERFQDDKVIKPVVYCSKIRDFNTGKILGLKIESDIDIKEKNVLILDDLCSRGGTFYHTAKALKEKGADKIYLAVCHMENSIMFGDLYNTEDVTHIYCLDTMLSKDDIRSLSDKITVYDTSIMFLQTQLKQHEQEARL